MVAFTPGLPPGVSTPELHLHFLCTMCIGYALCAYSVCITSTSIQITFTNL